MLVWQVFSKMHSASTDNFPVIIKNVSFKRAAILLPKTEMKFYVNILKHTGAFEISENDSVIATGKIEIMDNYNYDYETYEETNGSEVLTKNDFYQEINLRRYNYKDLYRSVTEYDLIKNEAKIRWYEKYDCFLDGMIQIGILDQLNNRNLRVPTFIEKVVVDPTSFLIEATKKKGKEENIYLLMNRD